MANARNSLPYAKLAVCGAVTAFGGLGHALPFVIRDFRTATTLAILVVTVELAIIGWVRNRFMDAPLISAAVQVVIGGLLVFGTLIGSF
jgi:VIT1/CCC1 family predicted Fe2+/Mn2+ transporter